jgi:hypothetical protein
VHLNQTKFVHGSTQGVQKSAHALEGQQTHSAHAVLVRVTGIVIATPGQALLLALDQ